MIYGCIDKLKGNLYGWGYKYARTLCEFGTCKFLELGLTFWLKFCLRVPGILFFASCKTYAQLPGGKFKGLLSVLTYSIAVLDAVVLFICCPTTDVHSLVDCLIKSLGHLGLVPKTNFNTCNRQKPSDPSILSVIVICDACGAGSWWSGPARTGNGPPPYPPGVISLWEIWKRTPLIETCGLSRSVGRQTLYRSSPYFLCIRVRISAVFPYKIRRSIFPIG